MVISDNHLNTKFIRAGNFLNVSNPTVNRNHEFRSLLCESLNSDTVESETLKVSVRNIILEIRITNLLEKIMEYDRARNSVRVIIAPDNNLPIIRDRLQNPFHRLLHPFQFKRVMHMRLVIGSEKFLCLRRASNSSMKKELAFEGRKLSQSLVSLLGNRSAYRVFSHIGHCITATLALFPIFLYTTNYPPERIRIPARPNGRSSDRSVRAGLLLATYYAFLHFLQNRRGRTFLLKGL